MLDVINLALPFFGLIFLGFGCGRFKAIPDSGLAWMDFFILYVALPLCSIGSSRRRRWNN
jgi:malonate transporter and related proteins